MQVYQIKTQADGTKFTGMYAVLSAEIRQTKNNKDFLSLVLADKTGKLPAKIWGFEGDAPLTGTIWSLDGEFSPYNGQSQAVVRKYAVVDPSTVEKTLFIGCLSNEDVQYYGDEFARLLGEIQDDKLREFTRYMLTEKYPDFTSNVGAKSNHHGFIGGLLMHSVNVTKLALGMANAYRGTPTYDMINTDLLIAGGLMHDIGKLGEYTLERNVIEFGVEGTLTRHYDTGPAYIMEAWVDAGRPIGRDVLNFLFHVAVTHHGIEHSQRPPSTMSAWFISAADGADAFTQAGLELMKESGVRDNGLTNDKSWMLRNHFYDETVLSVGS
jgi:3'-5' exoribonuclease